MITRILSAAVRGVQLGTAPGLAMGALTALFFWLDAGPSVATLEKGLQTATFGLYVGAVFASLACVAMPHDRRAAQTGIFEHRPAAAISAAFGSVAGAYMFHLGGAGLPWYVFTHAGLEGGCALSKERPGIAFCATILACGLGATIGPPRFLSVMALRSVTLFDFLGGFAPHHDEVIAATLPPPEHGRLHREAAAWWSLRGEAPRARMEWAEARRLGGMDKKSYVMCAAFFAATGSFGEAEKVLAEGLAMYPDEIGLRYERADVYERQDLEAEAESEYRSILAQHEHAPSLHALGNLLMKKQRLNEALELFDRAVAAPTSSSEDMVRYLNSRGATLATRGDLEAAERDFRRTIQIAQEVYTETHKHPQGMRDAVKNLGMLHGMRRRQSIKRNTSRRGDSDCKR